VLVPQILVAVGVHLAPLGDLGLGGFGAGGCVIQTS
jgi:hypothetical protein